MAGRVAEPGRCSHRARSSPTGRPGCGRWRADAEGNTCTPSNCGFGGETPDAHLGGGDADTTAGALCCPG